MSGSGRRLFLTLCLSLSLSLSVRGVFKFECELRGFLLHLTYLLHAYIYTTSARCHLPPASCQLPQYNYKVLPSNPTRLEREEKSSKASPSLASRNK